MKIGLDISQIVYKGTGVSRFTEGLVKAICEYDKENEWIFFFSSFRQSLDSSLEKLINFRGWKIIKLKLPSTGLSIIWNDLHVLKIETITGKLDWFISSDWTEPPATCKKATIVHDLVYLRYPETVNRLILRTQTKRLNWVGRESALILADSQSTKDDLIKLLNLNSKKVVVNYPGIEIKKPGKKIAVKKPFILTVGKIEPRKNINKLIDAFAEAKLKNVELLIVGPMGWNQNIKVRENIRFLGYVSESELYALYSSCLFFVYPSLWEGFGYPVLEAMSFGVPVATSNTSSLKEIGENAALFFDPTNVNEIKSALIKLAEDKKLRVELSRKGSQRAKEFTWKKYYDVMIKALW